MGVEHAEINWCPANQVLATDLIWRHNNGKSGLEHAIRTPKIRICVAEVLAIDWHGGIRHQIMQIVAKNWQVAGSNPHEQVPCKFSLLRCTRLERYLINMLRSNMLQLYTSEARPRPRNELFLWMSYCEWAASRRAHYEAQTCRFMLISHKGC